MRSQPLKIATWNVCGMKAILKKGDFQKFLQEEDPDILCLNETMLQEKYIHSVKQELPGCYYSYWNCSKARKGYSGVALLCKQKPLTVSYGIGTSKHDQEGRVITAEYSSCFVVSCYVPNSGGRGILMYRTREWDKDLREHLDDLQHIKPVIWCGDLNVVHQDIDVYDARGKESMPGCFPEERHSFAVTMLLNSFMDTYRLMNPDERGFSYYKRKNKTRTQGWRLDYIIVSCSLEEKVCEAYIREDFEGSDHRPCVTCMDLELIY